MRERETAKREGRRETNWIRICRFVDNWESHGFELNFRLFCTNNDKQTSMSNIVLHHRHPRSIQPTYHSHDNRRFRFGSGRWIEHLWQWTPWSERESTEEEQKASQSSHSLHRSTTDLSGEEFWSAEVFECAGPNGTSHASESVRHTSEDVVPKSKVRATIHPQPIDRWSCRIEQSGSDKRQWASNCSINDIFLLNNWPPVCRHHRGFRRSSPPLLTPF